MASVIHSGTELLDMTTSCVITRNLLSVSTLCQSSHIDNVIFGLYWHCWDIYFQLEVTLLLIIDNSSHKVHYVREGLRYHKYFHPAHSWISISKVSISLFLSLFLHQSAPHISATIKDTQFIQKP